ncbi:hypothetical protein C354_02523, partial [Cryptococcus neoformans MW-RSA1955]
KKAAVQPRRLLIDRRPSSRTTSPESIGEQIEVEAEDRSTPQAHPLSGGSSDGSHPPHMHLSILVYLFIHLHQLPAMNDVHHRQEVGLFLKHLQAQNGLKATLISTMLPSRHYLVPRFRFSPNFQRQCEPSCQITIGNIFAMFLPRQSCAHILQSGLVIVRNMKTGRLWQCLVTSFSFILATQSRSFNAWVITVISSHRQTNVTLLM